MINHINRSIETTHRLTGMPREEIVRRGLIRKEIPMYGLLGAAGMGALGKRRISMTNTDKQTVRQVLDCLSEIRNALDDALTAIGGEDIVAAKMALGQIIVSAEQAINILTPQEE